MLLSVSDDMQNEQTIYSLNTHNVFYNNALIIIELSLYYFLIRNSTTVASVGFLFHLYRFQLLNWFYYIFFVCLCLADQRPPFRHKGNK